MKTKIVVALAAITLALVHWVPAHAESGSFNFHDCSYYCGANDGGVTYTMNVTWSYAVGHIYNQSVSISNVSYYCDWDVDLNEYCPSVNSGVTWQGCVADPTGYSCGVNYYLETYVSPFRTDRSCWYDRVQIDSTLDVAWISQNLNVHPHGKPC